MLEFIPRFILILILVLLNGFFVASEFALVAMRKNRVAILVKKGNKSAIHIQKAQQSLDTYISSTQLGITLASLALGWLGEPTLAHFLEPFFKFLPDKSAIITAHSLAVISGFAFITFLHIVIGEIAPKTLALQKPEATSIAIITPLVIFTKIFKPVIYLLNKAGNLVLKVVGLNTATGHEVVHSEEEIKMILAQSTQKGIIEKNEADMVYKVLQFTDIPIKDVMIPITDTTVFSSQETAKDILSKIRESKHSRFPIYDRKPNNIIGFIHIKDLYLLLYTPEENKQLIDTKIIRDIIFAADIKPADEVLFEMKKRRIHIAVITNKKEKVYGIATLEDIIESIIGEINDEFEIPQK